MKVDQLRDPPAHYKIREIKDWYVSVLAKNMKDSTDHLTAPFVVVCDKTKDMFDKTKVNEYFYDVIGGVHRFNAIIII